MFLAELDNCADCPNESYENALKSYQLMGAALNRTGRAIFYMSELGTEYGCPTNARGKCQPGGNDTEIAPSIFNTDRVGRDISPDFTAVLQLIDTDEPHAPKARPGFFNDMDMVGHIIPLSIFDADRLSFSPALFSAT